MTWFSPDYVTARTRFRDAVRRAGGRLIALPLAARGPAGEDLTIDVGWLGDEQPHRVLLHSCGVHGVEAFAGSAIQLQWLSVVASPSERAVPLDLPAGFAVVLVHVVNPYGMAWLRRVNEHGVDLNRNCLAPDDRYEGAPPGYERLDVLLNPSDPPGRDAFLLRAGWLILRVGMATLKQTIAGGQYVNPDGLFFGGRSLEEGPARLRQFVREHLRGAGMLVGIDVHTGLGPFGIDTLLVDASTPPAIAAHLREHFGDRVTPLDPDRGPAYRVKGTYETLVRTALPDADLRLFGQEFGTYAPIRVLRALRAENRWHRHGAAAAHPSRLALRDVFVPPAESWRQQVLARGGEVLGQALDLITSSG